MPHFRSNPNFKPQLMLFPPAGESPGEEGHKHNGDDGEDK
jgi:hypothetical protein